MKDDGGAAPEQSRSPREGRKQILLRLDPAVHAALAKWAADDLRSVNALIEKILRDALRDEGRPVKAAPIRRPGRPKRAVPEEGIDA